MIVWLAVLIPILTTAVLAWRFAHQIHAGEMALMLGVPVILVCGGKHLADRAGTSDVEFLGDTVARAEYHEDWNERVSCRHPKYRTRTVGSGKNRRTVTEFAGYHHAYDVDYHPEWWGLFTQGGRTLRTSRAHFEDLAALFGSRAFVDLRRAYHTNDGDKYVATWDGAEATRAPVVVPHTYENRVQAAGSVFAYAPVDPRATPVHPYPPIDDRWRQPAILGGADVPARDAAGARLEQWNAVLGPAKQAKLFLCLFRDGDASLGLAQEAFWKGGNKNEFVVCVGLDAGHVARWAHAFSWSRADGLKAEARNQVIGTGAPIDLPAYVEWLGAAVQARFVRRDFREFDYLTVEPPTWAVILIYLLTLASTAALGAWAVLNDLRPQHGDPITDAWREVRRWARGR